MNKPLLFGAGSFLFCLSFASLAAEPSAERAVKAKETAAVAEPQYAPTYKGLLNLLGDMIHSEAYAIQNEPLEGTARPDVMALRNLLVVRTERLFAASEILRKATGQSPDKGLRDAAKALYVESNRLTGFIGVIPGKPGEMQNEVKYDDAAELRKRMPRIESLVKELKGALAGDK